MSKFWLAKAGILPKIDKTQENTNVTIEPQLILNIRPSTN